MSGSGHTQCGRVRQNKIHGPTLNLCIQGQRRTASGQQFSSHKRQKVLGVNFFTPGGVAFFTLLKK